jgi:hypothetical protein
VKILEFHDKEFEKLTKKEFSEREIHDRFLRKIKN